MSAVELSPHTNTDDAVGFLNAASGLPLSFGLGVVCRQVISCRRAAPGKA